MCDIDHFAVWHTVVLNKCAANILLQPGKGGRGGVFVVIRLNTQCRNKSELVLNVIVPLACPRYGASF